MSLANSSLKALLVEPNIMSSTYNWQMKSSPFFLKLLKVGKAPTISPISIKKG
jgi:hypothetical protein